MKTLRGALLVGGGWDQKSMTPAFHGGVCVWGGLKSQSQEAPGSLPSLQKSAKTFPTCTGLHTPTHLTRTPPGTA